MVSVLPSRKALGFDIDSLLGGQNVPVGDLEDVVEARQCATSVYPEIMDRSFTREVPFPNLNNQTTLNQRGGGGGVVDFCSTCCEHPQGGNDTIFTAVRPYDMANSNLSTRNFIRNAPGLGPHSWTFLEPVQQGSHTEFHRNNFGNLGFKLQNSLVQFDSISGSYSPFSGLFNPVSAGVQPQMTSRSDPGAAYSWSPARGGGYLSQTCSVNADAGLFMNPYRKPKRVRTAFSPTQLLRLEHAFEKNHYVVGQERKDLATSLNLSETQVKVWFQNRRTKHKRMKAEEEMTSSLTQRMQNRENSESPIFDDI